MKYVISIYEAVIPEKLQYYFALSRTHHGVLDMTAPVFAALVCLGAFPAPDVALAGVLAVFAGYTAVYALNDIAGYKDDRRHIRSVSVETPSADIDSVLLRHPLAQGVITLRWAVLWAGCWGAVAVAGAYYLNPLCVLIFLSGAALEVIYCFLLKISFLRIIISGFVKSAGPIAGVLAVDDTPDPLFLVLLFAFFFLWEAGGQNIPNDFTDMEEDRRINARTLPLKFGRDITCFLIMGLLLAAVVTMALVFSVSPIEFTWFSALLFCAGSLYLLILPGAALLKTRENRAAMTLFNRASYYPFFLLTVVLINMFTA